jgi:plastocyanin
MNANKIHELTLKIRRLLAEMTNNELPSDKLREVYTALTAINEIADEAENTTMSQIIVIKEASPSPNPKTVFTGSSLEFVNEDDVPYTIDFAPLDGLKVQGDHHVWPSPSMHVNDLLVTFLKSGRYEYSCAAHPSLSGVVVAQGGE